MDARHARRQQTNEPLMEIIQTKGSSDTILLKNSVFG
jgi:hypothetical protein